MLKYKSTTSRDSFVFTWGGKGLFSKGAIRFEVVAEIWNLKGRAVYSGDLDVLPADERAPAMAALVAFFRKCGDEVAIHGKPAWLPPDLEPLVIKSNEGN